LGRPQPEARALHLPRGEALWGLEAQGQLQVHLVHPSSHETIACMQYNMQPECRVVNQYTAPHMSPGCCSVQYMLNELFLSSLQLAALWLVLRGCMDSFHRPTGSLLLCTWHLPLWLHKGQEGFAGASIHIVGRSSTSCCARMQPSGHMPHAMGQVLLPSTLRPSARVLCIALQG